MFGAESRPPSQVSGGIGYRGAMRAAVFLVLVGCTGVEGDSDTSAPAPTPFTVVALNVESGGSDAGSVAEDTVAPIQGETLFAFEEVEYESDAELLVAAMNDGDQNLDFVFGTTGRDDKLVLAWDDDRFALVSTEELHEMNIPNGTVRSPLVGRMLDRVDGTEFLFVVNHLWRTEAESRHEQAELLNAWGAEQTLPIVTAGDFNFDWEVDGSDHDEGYDNLVADDVFAWVRPDPLLRTQCSDFYDSVLDFVFVGGAARDWDATSEILYPEDDYCRAARRDNYSDHRPVSATFTAQ